MALQLDLVNLYLCVNNPTDLNSETALKLALLA
uniref:Uncharacterized protein n=1 Tax=Moniliophthora roreri TaxID=221103 RepID=A0A0W0FS26_MONRR